MSDPIKNCIIDWPQAWHPAPAQTVVQNYTFVPSSPRLSDEDVERIAKRVVELLEEKRSCRAEP